MRTVEELKDIDKRLVEWLMKKRRQAAVMVLREIPPATSCRWAFGR